MCLEIPIVSLKPGLLRALWNFFEDSPRSPIDSSSRGWSALPSTKSLPCPGAIHDNRNVNVAAEEKAKTNLFLFSQQSYTQGNILCLVLFLTQCVFHSPFLDVSIQICWKQQKMHESAAWRVTTSHFPTFIVEE